MNRKKIIETVAELMNWPPDQVEASVADGSNEVINKYVEILEASDAAGNFPIEKEVPEWYFKPKNDLTKNLGI